MAEFPAPCRMKFRSFCAMMSQNIFRLDNALAINHSGMLRYNKEARIMKRAVSMLAVLLIITMGCSTQPSPKKAFKQFSAAMGQGDWSTVWDMLSKKSQKSFEDEGYKKMKETLETLPPDLKKERIAELGVTNEELMKMNVKDFFMLIMKKTDASKEFVKSGGKDEVERVQTGRNKARLKIKGKNEVATMVMEGGAWKMEFEED